MTRGITCAVTALLMVLGAASTTWAQVSGNPFDIDGVVTDFVNSGKVTGLTVPPCDPPADGGGNTGTSPQACKQNDPNGNAQELGPVNGDHTKIGVIHNGHIEEKTNGSVNGVQCTKQDPCYVYQNMLGTTNPNAQVDLNAAWIQSFIAPSPADGNKPHVYLYFAWRRDSASGSGFISLEVQKQQAGGFRNNCNYDAVNFNPNLCNPWAGRQGGDVIFLWDQSGSSTDILAAGILGPAAWDGTGDDVPRTLAIPDCSHPTSELFCVDLTDANAAEAVFGTNCGEGFVAGQCGEMVVDLTLLGVINLENPTSCQGIGNIIPGTVTGNSNTADYKDVILAPFPTISNCGTITVTKRTVTPDGTTLITAPLNNFGYTLNRIGGQDIRFTGQAVDNNSLTTIVRPNAFGGTALTTCTSTFALSPDPSPIFKPCGPVNTHTELIAATNYRLVESTPPVPWELVNIKCYQGSTLLDTGTAADPIEFAVTADTTTSCVITNKLLLGNPTGASRQRVIAADQVKIVNVTAGGSDNPAPALGRLTVRLALFSDASCTTQTAAENFALTAGTVSAGKQDLYMSGFSSPTLQKTFETQGAETVYWAFRWDGDTFNNPLTFAQTCASPGEGVTVTIIGSQATIP